MFISEIVEYLESFAPLCLQEDYDNSGLLVGDAGVSAKAALVSIDVNEKVLEEAEKLGCNLIISHHPVIFKGLKRLCGKTLQERVVMQAIRNDIILYAIHTNLDGIVGGVSSALAGRLEITDQQVLKPGNGQLRKLVSFCPSAQAEQVREAIFMAGAGHIGNYSQCSFNNEGWGTFLPGEETHPFVGEKGKIHTEREVRIETVFPYYRQEKVIEALIQSHPYEEVAYDIYPLMNENPLTGMGIIGKLPAEMTGNELLGYVKDKLGLTMMRHNLFTGQSLSKVAVCGGSGNFLLSAAIRRGAQAFITGDLKYHEFFDAENQCMLIDIGHYESEQYTKELIVKKLKEKFPTFASFISGVNTNPVYYF